MQGLKTNEGLLSGALVVVLGFLFAGLSTRLNFGSPSQMGAGFVPTILSWLLVAIGALLIVRSRTRPGVPDEWPKLRPLIIVCIAPLIFGALIRVVGLAATVVVTALFTRLALAGRVAVIDVIAAVLLSAFCCLTFVVFLGQSLPLWP